MTFNVKPTEHFRNKKLDCLKNIQKQFLNNSSKNEFSFQKARPFEKYKKYYLRRMIQWSEENYKTITAITITILITITIPPIVTFTFENDMTQNNGNFKCRSLQF